MQSDIRLVMLGLRDAGKTSAGNTILGGEHIHRSKIVQCVKGERDVDGRHVTVIKAPGWGKEQLLKDTPELMKEEMTLSVSLCPPGPHSVLLVMPAGMKVTEASRRAAQEHMELLGDNVWTHTIVLFTHGDWLGERSIEHYIESEGKPLQWLVDKCGNRYHVFSEDKDNKVQVSELFDKVEETVAENSGDHYKVDEGRLMAVEERRMESRAEEMKSKLLEQGQVLPKQNGGEPEKSAQPMKSKLTTCVLKDLRIVLLGQLKAGKASLGNRLIGRGGFQSETTVQSLKQQGKVAGRRITVINTPGWASEQGLSDTPELIRQEIILGVSQCDPGPHVLLLVIRADTSFTELNRRAVQEHMDLLGPEVWAHTLIVFNCESICEDTCGEFIEQYISKGGKALRWLLQQCGDRFYILNNGHTSDVKELVEVVETVAVENDGRHYELDREVLEEVEERRGRELERANDRKTRVMKQWEVLKNLADSYKMETGFGLENRRTSHQARNGDRRSRIPVLSKSVSSGSHWWWDTEDTDRPQLETSYRGVRPPTAARASGASGRRVRWQDQAEL